MYKYGVLYKTSHLYKYGVLYKNFHVYKYGVLNLHYMVIYENHHENRRLFGAHLIHHPTLGYSKLQTETPSASS